MPIRANVLSAQILVLLSMWPVMGVGESGGPVQETVNISVDDPRPMSTAIRALENRHGIVITYEDPPYMHPSQIADVTDAVARSPMPEGRRVLVPRGGRFDFSYPWPPNKSPGQMQQVLHRLVAEYEWTGHAGRFKVLRTGESFHVVPILMRNRNGQDEAYRAILDTEISISRQGRALEVLTEIEATLRKRTGAAVFLGTVPQGRSMATIISISAENEPARSVLMRALAATGARLSFALYYGPQSSAHVLNIHGVPLPEGSGPQATPVAVGVE